MKHLSQSERLAFYRKVMAQPPLPPPPSMVPGFLFALLAIVSAVALWVVIVNF